MRARLLNWLREIRSSYWFIPSAMVLAAVVFALLSDQIDRSVDSSFLAKIPWLYQNEPTGARAMLSAIATSMIGVAGVTFSMTIVSVSFAASNMGPRLIGNFMRDTGNQITLGTFIATFVYCLLVLRTVTDTSGPAGAVHVPHISLLIAMALALLSVSNLIYFIHHIPESINVAGIAHSIADELRESLTELFPAAVGNPATDRSAERPDLGPRFRVESKAVRDDKTGYVQFIDDESLMRLASDNDLVIRLEYRPGDFAQSGDVLLYANPSATVDDTLAASLAGCIVLGTKRTSSQNAMFLVDQLVEIMMRALSPGVNDPFTAVGCMDWLQAALAIVVRRGSIDPCRYDTDENLRVVVHAITFERFASAIFEQPLQYVAADRVAALRMMQVIAEIVAISDNPEYTKVLLDHAARLKHAGDDCLPVASDRVVLAERYEQTQRLAVDHTYRRSLRDNQGWLGGRG